MNIKTNMIILILLGFAALIGQQYNITGTSEVASWGPVYGEEDRTSSIMLDLLYLKLLTTNEDGKIVPVILTEAPKSEFINTGQSVLHLNLRDDIFWQDGSPVNTDDVKFTWKVIQNSNVNTAKEKISLIDDMDIKSDYQMDVFFNYNSEDNAGALTFYLLPRHELYHSENDNPYRLMPDNDFFVDKPVTNGKFTSLSVEYNKCVLQKNTRYFDPEVSDKLYGIFQWRSSDNFATIDTAVKNGSYNFVMDLPVRVWSNWDNMDNWGYRVNKTLDSFQMMGFNLRKEALKDTCLRLLFSYVISKNDINNNFLGNAATVLTGPFPGNSRFYNESVQSPSLRGESIEDKIEQFGFERISGHLEKSGKKIGPFTLVYLNSKPDDQEIAGYIEEKIKQELGIQIITEGRNDNEYTDRVFGTHNFDLALVEFSFGSDPSVYNIFHSDQIKAGGFNICGLSDPDIDVLLDEGRRAGGDKKVDIYHLQHEFLAKKLPAIFLFQKPFAVFAGREFNVTPENLDSNLIFKHIQKWRP
ncbi:MAG: hypothetical protein K9J13_03870 [Saprospiraceae bacterium]|nr:hypothetical protein [Saprospiraceae bacterium]